MINALTELDKRLTKLEEQQANLIRYGKISEIDYVLGVARVDFQNGIISPFIPYCQVPNIFIPLLVDDQVLVIAPMGELEKGLIIPKIYLQNTSLGSTEDEFIIKLNEGEIRYDGAVLTIKGNTKIVIQDETGGGVVCQNHLCSFTGAMHPQGSSKVKGAR